MRKMKPLLYIAVIGLYCVPGLFADSFEWESIGATPGWAVEGSFEVSYDSQPGVYYTFDMPGLSVTSLSFLIMFEGGGVGGAHRFGLEDLSWLRGGVQEGGVIAELESTITASQLFGVSSPGIGQDHTLHAYVPFLNREELNATGRWTLDRGAAPVPEPCTILLIGTGLIGFAVPRIRKKFKK